MSLRAKINDDLKAAMKAGDKRKVSALRLMNAAIKDKDINSRTDGHDSLLTADPGLIDLFAKMVKQRQDSIESFEKGGRAELAEKEKSELAILNSYLPVAMDVEEIARLVRETIAEVGATSRAQMGAVMKALGPKVAGRADGKTLSQEVQRQLG